MGICVTPPLLRYFGAGEGGVGSCVPVRCCSLAMEVMFCCFLTALDIVTVMWFFICS